MDNANTPGQNNVPGKKEVRKQMADKIASALPELKTTLGEKKFDNRIKKAVKLLTDGLHKKETAKAVKKGKAIAKKSAAKKAIPKKAKAAKKAASK